MDLMTAWLNRLRRSFWVIPFGGCFIGLILAVSVWKIDRIDALSDPISFMAFLTINEENARSVFATVAGAMATIMSLAYTLTLVVFTLAAGSLGPRLLDSFSDNRVNQTTIAIVGGTFLYSLTSLYLFTNEQQAKFSALVAIILAVLAIGSLIYFVHDVAKRVLVDNEIARTAGRLSDSIKSIFHATDEKSSSDDKWQPGDAPYRSIFAVESGYLLSINPEGIVKTAVEHDCVVELLIAPGDFMVANAPIGRVYGGPNLSNDVARHLNVGKSRTSEGDVLFSIHLLIEIAIRALSPGINDSYTAISCIDHLSAALSELLQREAPSPIHCDEENNPRLIVMIIEIDAVLSTAFHPLRRNAQGNVMVSQALIAALERMASVSKKQHLDTLQMHVQLIASDALPDRSAQTDKKHLDLLVNSFNEAVTARRREEHRVPNITVSVRDADVSSL